MGSACSTVISLWSTLILGGAIGVTIVNVVTMIRMKRDSRRETAALREVFTNLERLGSPRLPD